MRKIIITDRTVIPAASALNLRTSRIDGGFLSDIRPSWKMNTICIQYANVCKTLEIRYSF